MSFLSLVFLAAMPSLAEDEPVFAAVSQRVFLDGRKAYQDRRYVEAADLLKQALLENPEDVEALILLGKSYQAQGDQLPVMNEEDWSLADSFYEKSENAYYRALDIDSECGAAWAALGESHMRRGNSEEALATLYHAQSFPTAGLEVRLTLADALLLSRDYALEMSNFDHAMTRLEEAEAILDQALSEMDVYVQLLRRHAEVKAARGEAEESLRSYRKAISLQPQNTLLHDSYMDVVESTQSVNESVEFYKGLVDAPALALWYGAVSQELRGHLAFNRDLDYELSSSAYLKAEEMLLNSSASNPAYEDAARQRVPFVRSYRGYALAKLGKLEEAEAAFLSALDRDPTLDNAKQGLKNLMDEYWLQIGGESAGAEEFDRIRSFAARVCVVLPKDPDVWNNYGFFAREAGRYEESYQAYRRAMTLAPDNARILNDTALILVYHLHRDLDLAEQWLLEARDIADEDRENSVEGADESYGDSLVNLITLYYLVSEDQQAQTVFDRLEEEIPDRSELQFWEKRLYPERVEVVETEEAVDTVPPNLAPASEETDG